MNLHQYNIDEVIQDLQKWMDSPMKYESAVLLSRMTCNGRIGKGWLGINSSSGSTGFS